MCINIYAVRLGKKFGIGSIILKTEHSLTDKSIQSCYFWPRHMTQQSDPILRYCRRRLRFFSFISFTKDMTDTFTFRFLRTVQKVHYVLFSFFCFLFFLMKMSVFPLRVSKACVLIWKKKLTGLFQSAFQPKFSLLFRKVIRSSYCMGSSCHGDQHRDISHKLCVLFFLLFLTWPRSLSSHGLDACKAFVPEWS